jgi:hypothetical protein
MTLAPLLVLSSAAARPEATLGAKHLNDHGGRNNVNVVSDWNATMLEALATAGTPAPPGTRIGAIVQAAVFDAVNGVKPRFTPIHVQPAAPKHASAEAAAASAAHEALVGLFPAQQAMLDARLAASLAAIGGRKEDHKGSISSGVAWGKTVADAILAWRAADHFSDPLGPYSAGGAPGDWQPTPPGFITPPLFRNLGVTTPFAMTSPSQFRPAGPPALTSPQYTADFNEVKAFGNSTTPFQAETARFWNGDTVTAFWDRVAEQLTARRHLSLSQNARLFAELNISLADAAIAVWEAKNFFDSWRPVTAIAQAALDGNPDTTAQAGWTPLIVTPAFQEYPSGHSGVSSAATTMLASVFGNDTSFTVTSAGLPGVERNFTSFSDAIAQVADARVFGGIHFRSACVDAARMGVEVADRVNDTMFLRVREDDEEDD